MRQVRRIRHTQTLALFPRLVGEVDGVVVTLEGVVFGKRRPIGPVHGNAGLHLGKNVGWAFGYEAFDPVIGVARNGIRKEEFQILGVRQDANFFLGLAACGLGHDFTRVLFSTWEIVHGAVAPGAHSKELGVRGMHQQQAGRFGHVGELGWYGQIGVHASIVTGPPEGGHGGRAVCLSGRSDGC